jgi:hypothetical protein
MLRRALSMQVFFNFCTCRKRAAPRCLRVMIQLAESFQWGVAFVPYPGHFVRISRLGQMRERRAYADFQILK